MPSQGRKHIDNLDQFRRAAGYVDCILKGENPAELAAVQAPTKYKLVINLKTAKALALELPVTLVADRLTSASGPQQT